jgi:hypothetical protein
VIRCVPFARAAHKRNGKKRVSWGCVCPLLRLLSMGLNPFRFVLVDHWPTTRKANGCDVETPMNVSRFRMRSI